LLGIIAFIEGGLTREQKARVLAVVPPERVDTKQIGPNDLFPIEQSNELVRAIAGAFPDETDRYEVFVRCGQFIANDAINSFLRLLIKFLKPDLFARKYGTFFRRAHTFGEVQAKDFTDHSFVLEMSDVDGYLYVAPISIGFMKHTLAAMGCKELQVREVLSPPPAPQVGDNYKFEVNWS
jgi:uncharacterized protein (TIGR02265 family)